jgi:O-antigen/teichoic acid export membrane protein
MKQTFTSNPAFGSGLEQLRRNFVPLALFAVGLVSTFAGQLVLSKTTGANEFGLYVLAYNAAAVLSGLGAAGFDLSAVRCASLFKSKGDWTRLAAFKSLALRWTLGTSIIVAAIFAIFFSWNTGSPWSLVLIGAAVTTSWSWSRVLAGYLRGLGRLAPALTTDRVSRDLAVLLFASVALALDERLSIVMALLTLLLGTVSGCCIGLLFGRALPEAAVTNARAHSEAAENTQTWIRLSLGLMAYNFVELLSSRFDVFALSLFADTAIVGAFGLAILLINLVTIPASFISLLIMPQVAVAHDGKDTARLRQIYALASISAVCAGFGVMGLMWILYPYGQAYLPPAFSQYIAIAPLLAAVAARAVCLVGTFPPVLLMMSGHHKALIASHVASIVTRAGAFLLFAQFVDANFAVAAFVVGAALVTILNIFQVRKILWPTAIQ